MSQEKLLTLIGKIKAEHDFNSLIAHMKCDEFASSDDEAWDYIEAFLQYFCLNALTDDTLAIPSGMVDEVHHLFVLNQTGNYREFCLKFFGKGIPHVHRTFYSMKGGVDCIPNATQTTISLLRLYDPHLHPILTEWITWVEHVESLGPLERKRYIQYQNLKRLVFLARHYLERAHELQDAIARDLQE